MRLKRLLSCLINGHPSFHDHPRLVGTLRVCTHCGTTLPSAEDQPPTPLEHSDAPLWTHRPEDCIGTGACTIHNRSDHSMRSFPQHWRSDRQIMERICPHGVGHPDPDDLTADTVHGCDGCCAPRLDTAQAPG